MTNVTNLRRDRKVAVRDGSGKIVYIQVGQTVNVVGFDKDREFHADLEAEGSIKIGGKAEKEADDSETRGQDLKAALEAAQTNFKQKKDALVEANKALKENPEDGATKKARAEAGTAFKTAEKELGEAQDAFDRG